MSAPDGEAGAPERGGPGAAPPSLAARVVRVFIDSKITPLVLLFAIFVGGLAVLELPREEEPQIQVPLIDVVVPLPGASPKEVEQRVTFPLERLLWEIPGVEYLHSTSSYGMAFVVARFVVGHDEPAAYLAVQRKLGAHADRLPPGAGAPLVQPRSIDDVPILALTLWSERRDGFELRRLAEELAARVRAVPNVSQVEVIGGPRREVTVELDPAALAARGLTGADVLARLRSADARGRSGSLQAGGVEVLVEAGARPATLEEVAGTVVGGSGDALVRLSDVASLRDGPEEPRAHVFLVPGPPLLAPEDSGAFPAVTLAISKRAGANAVRVSSRVLALVEREQGATLPADVDVRVARDYGETAAEKSNELLLHMGIAVVSVTLLIAFFLGWRESGIVAIAIPVTLALTLAIFYLLGYTLNRITLFALIFSIGILVDDPIVDVENVVRHFRMSRNRGRSLLDVTVEAVDEVRSPLILATLAVVCAVLPMAFVRGLMGPYMRPIPVGASAAMLVSMGVAFVITPWAAHRVLRRSAERGALHGHEGGREDLLTRGYRRVMGVLLRSSAWRAAFLGGILALLLAALALVPLQAVVVKMLPFDDKSELQVVIDMPEGSTLEATTAAALDLAHALRVEPEVEDVGVYAGTASPYNFNGLVRHYFLRGGPTVADLLVHLVGKHERAVQSHAFAQRIRPRVEELGRRHGARVAIAEVPPGPPVLQTLVAEVYGPEPRRAALAERLLRLFEATPGVVDVDSSVEDDQVVERVVIDELAAASRGVTVASAQEALQVALAGATASLLHDELAREPVPIVLRLPRARRASLDEVLDVRAPSRTGPPVALREIARVERGLAERSIRHKNLLPVHLVTGDVSGRIESSAYAVLSMRRHLQELSDVPVAEHWADVPYDASGPAVKWDGEMHVTIEVFRDLGIAFGIVLLLIYVLVVGWFRSFVTPLIIMAAIPFSMVGILPAHWAMGAFFTATSIIGFIAGAGIVVRNSIILVDFVELRLSEGMPLAQAVVDAGAIRFRPMLLTAAAVMAGAGVILFDPIFQGLAISLIAGEVASMTLSRMAVPVLYFLVHRRRHA